MTSEAPDDPVTAGVAQLVGRLAKLEPGFNHAADLFRELGMKSAAALELLMALEEEFGITVSDDDFAEARTVDQLAALVRRAKEAA